MFYFSLKQTPFVCIDCSARPCSSHRECSVIAPPLKAATLLFPPKKFVLYLTNIYVVPVSHVRKTQFLEVDSNAKGAIQFPQKTFVWVFKSRILFLTVY